MATSIGSLFATLRLDGTGFKRELSRSQKEIKNFANVAKRAGGLIAGFLGASSVASIGLLTKSTVAYADSIAKTADKLGISTKALQEWQYVAELSGVEAGTLNKSILNFQKGLGDAAKGTGLLKDDLMRMSIGIKNADGSLRGVDDIMPEFLDKLGRMEDITDRNSIAMNAWGARGTTMINVALAGAAGIDKMRKAANDLGLVIDDKLLRQSEQVNDQFSTFGKILSITVKNAVLESLPQIQALMKSLIDNRENIKDVVKNFLAIGSALLQGAAAAAKFTNELGKGIGIKAAQLLGPEPADDRLARNIQQYTEEQEKLGKILVETGGGLQHQRDRFVELTKWINEAKAELKEYNNIEPPKPKDLIPKPALTNVFKPLAPKTKPLKEAKESMEEFNKEWERQIKLANEGEAVWKSTRTAAENLAIEFKRLNYLLSTGDIDEETYSRAVKNAQDEFDSLNKKLDKTDDVAKDLGLTFSSAFEDAIVNGGKLSDILGGLEKDIIRILARKLITEPLAASITGSLKGGGGFLSNIFGSIFGGGKAIGGPVTAGTPYLVGENGPELFTPQGSGNITPNNKLTGTTTININVSGIRDEGGLKQAAGQIAAQAARAVSRGNRNL